MSLSQLQNRLGYHFSNIDILNRALTHRSVGAGNNERLEFLGDSIVGFYVAQALYIKFPHAKEGQLTRMRAALVNQSALSHLSRNLKLMDYLNLGPGELKSGGYDRDSILADAFEALVAGVYLDSDMDTVFTLLDKLYVHAMEEISVDNLKDPKTRLQEFLQASNWPLPQYELLEQSGPAHNLTFRVSCRLHDGRVFSASATNRRHAEQKAADKALAKISK